jgi:hypothetical protein
MSHILLCPRKEPRNVVYSGNTTRLAFLTDPPFRLLFYMAFLTDPPFLIPLAFFPTFECRCIRTYICTFIEERQLKSFKVTV